MSAVIEAVIDGDLLSIRDFLAEEIEKHLGHRSPRVRSGCTMVCLMWQIVLASTAPGDAEAANIARCMLVDALALLGPA